MKKNLFKFFGAAMFTALVLNPNKSNAQVGAALNFDGTSDQVNLGTGITTTLNPLTNITVEAWVYPSSSAGFGLIVGNYSSPLNQGQFFLRRQGMDYAFVINSGAGFQGYGAVNSVTLNTWTHLAGVWNGTVVTLYVNGVFTGTAATAVNAFSAAACTNSVVIGWENAGGGEGFAGNIDEVRIWGVARTQCQINTYKNCEIPTTSTSLIANYHFNQGVAAAANPTVITLTDVAGSSYTGTLTTFALAGATSNWITPGGVVSGFTTALASPTLNIVSSQTAAACPGTTANLTASGATTYAWVAPLTSTVAVANITLQANSPTYSVTGTASTGCAGTGTFVQAVTPNPVTVSTSNTLMCTGETVTLTASGGTAYTWQAPLTSTVAAAVISPTAAGNFTYTVLSTSSVCANYTWTTAFTQSVSGCVGIQNAVSQALSFGVYPNPTAGILHVELSGSIAVTEKIKVLNALGQLLIEQNLIENKATLNMNQLNNGIYFIKIGSSTKKIVKE